ncbi:glycoside hydrolase family 5 protein [Niveomyces insectorum RCEF 264]|uniref:Glycoside hydrolase family 5 protein n=1 Tax=Niveomyces insectorum RCEF 264 TaxID=1081102 RepID=A0A167QXJ0_9HYPO|nr:glycoside hydrolase family 5 protein [Niveomyces insectorum RCEF 264]
MKFFERAVTVLSGLTATAMAVAEAAAPVLPLHTSSRWILDATDTRVKFRCVNWAGHLEVNLPEGLHKQSIATLADWVQAQGFNCVRLTYSIDHALHPDVSVADAFRNAAAAAGVPPANMTALYEAAVAHNPFLGDPATTTRDVFGAVVDALWARGVMTLLDNHVSKASWCCNLTDGNGWWDTAFGYVAANAQYFNTTEWLQGLQAMAAWARGGGGGGGSGDDDNDDSDHGHPGVVAFSLRNELRAFLLQDTNDGADWYALLAEAGALVHAAHPDALVVVGGVDSATNLARVRGGGGDRMLNTTAWAGKHVWEWHAYSFTVTFPRFLPCGALQDVYGALVGFVLTQGQAYTAPLLLSEFGVDQTGGGGGGGGGGAGGSANAGGLSSVDSAYLACLAQYMQGNDAEWAVWALQGSYYVRNQQTDYDETWGLLDHAWAAPRNPQFAGLLGSMWNMTQGP